MNRIVGYYNTFKPFDAWCLGPYLPTATLSRISGLTIRETAALKRLCTALKTMTESEYRDRVKALEHTAQSAEENTAQPESMSQREISEIVGKLTPWLTEALIGKIPPNLQESFLAVPQYAIKRAYRGKYFFANYSKAVCAYQDQRSGTTADGKNSKCNASQPAVSQKPSDADTDHSSSVEGKTLKGGENK